MDSDNVIGPTPLMRLARKLLICMRRYEKQNSAERGESEHDGAFAPSPVLCHFNQLVALEDEAGVSGELGTVLHRWAEQTGACLGNLSMWLDQQPTKPEGSAGER